MAAMDTIIDEEESYEDVEATDKESSKHDTRTIHSEKSKQDMAALDRQKSKQDMAALDRPKSNQDMAALDRQKNKQNMISMRSQESKSGMGVTETFDDMSPTPNQESRSGMDVKKNYDDMPPIDSQKSKQDLVATDSKKSISFSQTSKPSMSTSERRVSIPNAPYINSFSSHTASYAFLSQIQEKIASRISLMSNSSSTLFHSGESPTSSGTHFDGFDSIHMRQKEINKLLREKICVQGRCALIIRKWQDATVQELPPIRTISNEETDEDTGLEQARSLSEMEGNFYAGFGYFLVDKIRCERKRLQLFNVSDPGLPTLCERKFTTLNKYRSIISTVPDYDTKDRLLCFAHDYIEKIVKGTTHRQRTLLLLEILNTIERCSKGPLPADSESVLQNVGSTMKGLEASYIGITLSQMEKLLKLKIRISRSESLAALRSLTLSSMAISDDSNLGRLLSTNSIDNILQASSEEDIANIPSRDVASCRSLLKYIRENQGECDQEDMSNIEQKMRVMAKSVTLREKQAVRARLVMERQMEDLEIMQERQEEMDCKLKKLRQKLQVLIVKSKTSRPNLKERKVFKRLSLHSESDRESNINNQNDPIESNMNNQNEENNIVKDKQREAKTAEENGNSEEEENRSVEDDSGSSDDDSERDSEDSARLSNSRKVLKLKPSAEQFSIKSRMDSFKKAMKDSKSRSFENDDDIKHHMLTYIKESRDHSEALFEILKNLTKKAREEEMTIIHKCKGFEKIANSMKTLIFKVKERRGCIPSISFRKNSCSIMNRISAEHTCMKCMCHQVPETIHVNMHASAAVAEKSYNEYNEWLTAVRTQYSAAYTKLVTTYTSTRQASETAFRKTDDATETSIDEVVQEDLARMANVAEDENSLLQHTKDVQRSVSNITNQIIAIIRELADHLNTTRSQTIFLDNLSEFLYSMELTMETILLGMAQNRSHGRVLPTGKILNVFFCRDCQCHCVPDFALTPKPLTTVKKKYLEWMNQTKAVTLCLAHQGLEAVFNLHPEEKKIREECSLPRGLKTWAKDMDTKVKHAMDLLIKHGVGRKDSTGDAQRRNSKPPSVSGSDEYI